MNMVRCAGVAQLVEQLIRNQQASGSNPLAGFQDYKGISANFSRIPFFNDTPILISFLKTSLTLWPAVTVGAENNRLLQYRNMKKIMTI